MSAKRIGIMKIRQILQFKKRGESNRTISQLVGVHRNTVNEHVRLFKESGFGFEELEKWSDKALSELIASPPAIGQTRYQTLFNYFPYIRKELKKVGCTRLALWREYINKHPEGYRYSQFNGHLRDWLKTVDGSSKLIHKAGDKLYVDYTGKKLHYLDKTTGKAVPVEVFVAILPCSGYTFVEATRSQRREDFIDSMNNCLSFLGGVPKSIVPDNLKSAVSKGSKYEPVINKTFADFALHYNCSINPTRAYSPKDKALVEGAVKLVYQRIFYTLNKQQFFSLEALNKQVSILLQKYNDQLFSLINMSRLQQFEAVEQSELGPLPAQGYEMRSYKKATVQKMGHILLSEDKHYYSVPFRYIGKKVEVQYNSRTVEVYYCKERIAIHKRDYQLGRYTTIDDHMGSTHRFYKDWSPEYFQTWASKYGKEVEHYVTGLIKQADYPETAYKQCMGILHLKREYSSYRLRCACRRALEHPRFSYQLVRDILKNNMDKAPDLFSEKDKHTIPKHSNIRGGEYYD